MTVGKLRMIALAGVALLSSVGIELALASQPASAVRGLRTPVFATCTPSGVDALTPAMNASLAGTNAFAAQPGPVYGTVSGCSSTSTRVTPAGLSVSLPDPGMGGLAGTGVVYWQNGKTTTYTYSAVYASFSCPTHSGRSGQPMDYTFTNVGGTAKVTGDGSTQACLYADADGFVYIQSINDLSI